MLKRSDRRLWAACPALVPRKAATGPALVALSERSCTEKNERAWGQSSISSVSSLVRSHYAKPSFELAHSSSTRSRAFAPCLPHYLSQTTEPSLFAPRSNLHASSYDDPRWQDQPRLATGPRIRNKEDQPCVERSSRMEGSAFRHAPSFPPYHQVSAELGVPLQPRHGLGCFPLEPAPQVGRKSVALTMSRSPHRNARHPR